MTLESAKQYYARELSHNHGNRFQTSLTLVSKWGKKEFSSNREWVDFLKFCDQQSDLHHPENEAELCYSIGYNFDINGLLYEAFAYYVRVEDLVKELPARKVPFFYGLHERMGLLYYNFKSYKLARRHFAYVLQGSSAPVQLRISTSNALGLIYRNLNEDDSARICFEKALLLARKDNRQDWIGILSGNLGTYYFKRNDLVRAERLVRTDYEISSTTKQWESAMNALALLAEIDMRNGRLERAGEKLKQTEDLMKRHYHSMGVQLILYRTRMLLNEARGDYASAYRDQNTFIAYQDSINQQMNLEDFHNAEFQMAFQKKQSQIQLLESRRKRTEQFFQLTIMVIGIVLAGVAIVLRQIMLRRRKEKEVLVLQQLRMADELRSIEEQMRLVLSNLSEKNELVNELQTEIGQFHTRSASKLSPEEQEILSDKLQSFKLLTEDDWDEFRKLFEKLNPGFFDKFRQMSTSLSKADLRLAALLRLNCSTSEIARVLGISHESVKRTHLRLRKKLTLDEQKELSDLIQSL
jgi:tetratricopeptide (TPR) repeat protein